MTAARFGALGLVLVSACAAPPARTVDSPGLAFPTTLGEGSPQPGKEPRSPRPDAGAGRDAPSHEGAAESDGASNVAAAAPSARPAPSASPPDPEPLRLAAQWEYEIASDEGVLSVASVKRVDLPKPIVSARRMGRYAIELWIGSELVERVRFDMPLLTGGTPEEPPRKGAFPPPDLEKGAHVRTRVLVPRAERARRAVLVDRASEQVIPLPWPPDRAAPVN
jgi:hypothetical protein